MIGRFCQERLVFSNWPIFAFCSVVIALCYALSSTARAVAAVGSRSQLELKAGSLLRLRSAHSRHRPSRSTVSALLVIVLQIGMIFRFLLEFVKASTL